MNSKKIYGPWIEWHGDECPVPPDTIVKARLRSGEQEGPRFADTYDWRHHGLNIDIAEYRIAIEQSDLEAAEQLLRANGYGITPPAKPLTFDDVTPMTEVPEKGTTYWAVHAFNKDGVALVSWHADDRDKAALRHRMAYLDKEHALIAAQHIFGLKGGEL